MAFIQIQRNSQDAVLTGDKVIFDQVVGQDGISYDTFTGEVAVDAGTYFVSWWTASSNVGDTNGASFALITSDQREFISNSVLKNSITAGFAIVEADIPLSLWLSNFDAGTAFFTGRNQVKASLTVTKLDGRLGGECYAVQQLEYVLSQMLIMYPDTSASVFVDRLPSYAANIHSLYKPAGADSAAFLVMQSGAEYLIQPLLTINALYFPNIIWDTDIDFLPRPVKLDDCMSVKLAAWAEYFPTGSDMSVNFGITTVASGNLYKNEFGIMVLTDEEELATPIIIFTPNIINAITALSPLGTRRSAEKPKGGSVTIYSERV